jgi:asparagine synthase (glutamine-hydrolysing)
MMATHAYVGRLVNLLDPSGNLIFNMSVEDAIARVGSGDAAQVRAIDGQFALLHQQGHIVRMARSIGRPMRYFLAKKAEGPCLVVAERIEELAQWLRQEGLDDQFHPSYTRMVPAHHITEIALLGCPDPNPKLTRYFDPARNRWSADINDIGQRYIGALADECQKWLDTIDRVDPRSPIGVMFSGGIDSGALFLVLYHLLLRRGSSPARLKAFTLSVGDEQGLGPDAQQAAQFLNDVDLGLFLEVIDVAPEALDVRETIRVIEDYKPLDVQSATMGLALCCGIRQRYPDWKFLADGDGGDENLKDYPIEDNPELTIRSVLNNQMLYHEGWGVNAIKHSLTYSGGQSRGHVRTFAPARVCGFSGFSPYALPNVIEVAEGIPFIELTDWDHQKLYELKGEIVRRGVEAVTGITMPVFEKRRFQHGAAQSATLQSLFAQSERSYRDTLNALFS